jgi:hypothetical protein
MYDTSAWVWDVPPFNARYVGAIYLGLGLMRSFQKR